MDFDNYEMKEKEQEQEQEQERERQEAEEANQGGEEETNFDDIDDLLVDIGGQDQLDNIDDIGDLLDDIGKDTHNVRRATTNNIKKVFRSVFDISIEKKNGQGSTKILENTKFISSKNRRISIEFKGNRIGWVERNGNVELFEKKNKKLVSEFRETMDLAKLEYEKSPSSLVKNLPEEIVDNVLLSSVERIEDRIEERTATLSEQQLREFAGVLNPKGTPEIKIKALELQADYWEKIKLEAEGVVETDGADESMVEKAKGQVSLFDSLEKTARLQADSERLKINEKPIHDESLDIINDEIQTNDLSRLERFKEWAKRNLVGISAIAITLAGIATTVIIAGRSAVKATAKATGRLAKALVNLGKKLGPLIAPFLNLMAQAISWGAKGIAFLAKNLWMIVIAFAWFLFKAYKSYRKK